MAAKDVKFSFERLKHMKSGPSFMMDGIEKIEAPDVLHIHLVEAIALIRVGRKDDAKAAVGRILDIRPDYGLVVRDDLALRNVEPKLAAKIVDALQDAGLPVR